MVGELGDGDETPDEAAAQPEKAEPAGGDGPAEPSQGLHESFNEEAAAPKQSLSETFNDAAAPPDKAPEGDEDGKSKKDGDKSADTTLDFGYSPKEAADPPEKETPSPKPTRKRSEPRP
jgi:hypothetical protein